MAASQITLSVNVRYIYRYKTLILQCLIAMLKIFTYFRFTVNRRYPILQDFWRLFFFTF
jgi:hypothetical protein